jgi:putative inorganic carbon (hco3(-)) transporter
MIYALIILVPMAYHTGFQSAFTTPKLVVVRVITLAIITVWGLQIFAEKSIRYRASALNKWIIGLGLVHIVTTFLSSYFWVSFFGDQGRFLGLMTMLNLLFLLIVTLNFFQNKDEIHRYIKVSIWTAVALAIYGLLQFKGIVGAENWDHDPTLRVFGTMGHSNHFGAYLAFHAMLMMGPILNGKRRPERWVYLLGLVPMVIAILATASRGAFFALMGAGFVFLIAMVYQRREWFKNKLKPIAAVLITLTIAGGIFHGPIKEKLDDIYLVRRTISTIDFMIEGNVPDRVSWWFSSLAMTRDDPILGKGLSTFRDNYNLYRRTDYRVPGDVQDTVTPESAHMEYLNIAATQGLLGLFVYLGLVFGWFKLLFKLLSNQEVSVKRKITALTLLTAGLVYFFQVLMSFGVIGTLTPLYMLLGISAAYYHVVADPTPQTKQFKIVKLTSGETVGGAIGLMIVVLFSGWFTYRQAAAEWYYQEAIDYAKEGEVGLMLEAHEKNVKAMPWMYRYWEEYGRNTFEFGTYDNEIQIVDHLLTTSIQSYENAYSLVHSQPYLAANLGLSYIVYSNVLVSEGEEQRAEEYDELGTTLYKEAVTIGVNNPIYPYNLGKLLLSFGDLEGGIETFEHILTFRDPYLDVHYLLANIYTGQADYEKAREHIQKAIEQDPSNEDVKALLQRINAEG